MSSVNPVTYQVLRNRLLALTEEMRIALQSVSGSPTVTEASDFFTGLFTPDGATATMGFQVSFQAPVCGTFIRHIQHKTKMPLRDGDIFIGNDPYIGALHQNDVQMVGPIFVGDEILCWAGVEAHETDVGGMDFASWCPKARDVFQEGFRIPAVKLVDRGEMREDVLDMILTASRLPDQLGLDIAAFVATINVARERIAGLVARYGADTIRTVMARMIEDSATRMRARIAELPDGVFRGTDFLEHDGHTNALYGIDLVLTKKGDRLIFDYSGTSRQAPGFINCTRAGLEGAVTGSLLSTFAWDIAWNQGVMRNVEIIAPDGLLVTAQFPAPVGAATIEAIWCTSNATNIALAKLLGCSDAHRYHAMAVGTGAMATFNLGGVNQYGENFGLHLMDSLAGGSGAFVSRDGVHFGGPVNAPAPSIADVERNEQASPLFYMHRRLATDSAGAGRTRGGASAEVALTLAVPTAMALIMTHGLEAPNSAGLFGGYPAATVRQSMGSGAASDGRPADGTWQAFDPKPGLMPMTKADVFSSSWQGGGGVGDPLDREPEKVAADVRARIVSRAATARIYGVKLSGDGDVLADDTQTLRRAMRLERVGGRFLEDASRQFTGEIVRGFGIGLAVGRDARGLHVVSDAGCILSSGTTAWRAGALARRVEALPAEANIRLHADLAATFFYCPMSGALLSLDFHRKNEAPRDDILLDLEALVTEKRAA